MLKFLIEKEFKQIFRNSFLPRLIIAMPVMMMLVMPFAANQEIKKIKLSIVDNDRSSTSERLIQKITSSGYFNLTDISTSYAQAINSLQSHQADIILELPDEFDKNLVKEGFAKTLITANAVNGIKGGLGTSYLTSILTDYATELRSEQGFYNMASGSLPEIQIIPQYRFNPHLDYKIFMVPALMVMLLTMLCGFLPALNIVGEKESGTIEQINVTPVKKHIFVLGKLIPYWTIGFVVLNICILLAILVYGLSPAGNLLTIYFFAMLYIVVVSGMGLVISNYSNTMQQAMFVMFFFVIIFILMSGLFTPIASMPDWAQAITIVNPLKYFMQIMRLVYLKGSTFRELTTPFYALLSFAIVFNSWAILSYKKNS